MFISTGLEPLVKHQRVLKTDTVIALGHIAGEYPVPGISLQTGHLWVVELRNKDRAVQEILLLSKEPKVNRRGVKLSIPDKSPADFASRMYEHARRQHQIPDDAVIVERELYLLNVKEQDIIWYELEI